MVNALKFIATNLDTIKLGAELAIFITLALSNSARGSIAAVYEILKKGAELTDEQALQTASDLMGKKLPFIPENLRKIVIQWLFDSMKKAVKKNK